MSEKKRNDYCNFFCVSAKKLSKFQLLADSNSDNIERWSALTSTLVRQVLDFARSISAYEKVIAFLRYFYIYNFSI